MMIEQGKIYVVPPNRHLLIENGWMHLGAGPKERRVRLTGLVGVAS
jgi:chemotaxis response regulator CheB